MEQYKRAFRDPRSPLTPLTPLAANQFNFEIRSAKSPFTPKAAHGIVQCCKQKLAIPRRNSPIRLLPTPQHFSRHFLEVRDVFEQQKPIKLQVPPAVRKLGAATRKCCCSNKATTRDNGDNIITPSKPSSVMMHLTPQQQHEQQQRYKQASPIAPRLLSPRVRSLLHKLELDHLSGIFCRQEIDTDVFQLMTLEDLKSLGIGKPRELHQLLNAIKFMREMF